MTNVFNPHLRFNGRSNNWTRLFRLSTGDSTSQDRPFSSPLQTLFK